MKQYQIAVLIGSLRKDSFNRKLANALSKMMPSDFVLNQIRIDDLPLYNQDNDANQAPSVLRIKKEVKEADGVLFVTPEYNRSFPGVLKNALDNASRPYGQNAFAGKRGGVIGISPGAAGTALAQQHLRNVLAYLDVPLLCQPEAYLQAKEGFFDNEGNIGENSKKFIQSWVDAYVKWVKEEVAT